MKIKRVTSQSSESIAEYFASVAEENRVNGADSLIVKMQRDFADIMSQFEAFADDSRPVFASVTDSSLNVTLLAKDDEASAAIAHLSPDISSTGNCIVHVWYPMLKSEAPWPNAIVSGNALNVREAFQMVAIALERSANSIAPGQRT